jgi:hypothetical protein
MINLLPNPHDKPAALLFSRIVCLPCREETIRGYSHVSLLVIDEAARVPDDLYCAVRPMLAVSAGRLICLSTPYGKRGFFWDAWSRGGKDWARTEVPADRIVRITPAFLAQERRCLGESWFRQEYGCSFEALQGLVYPDFARCLFTGPVPAGGQRVGGIDFGFRNPFATVWGTLDRDRVLWLTGEHYARQRPLSYHATQLPRDVMWYCDPSGANERNELVVVNFKIRRGDNALRPGIAAVSTRLEDGTLRVLDGACPNLLAEAALAETQEQIHHRLLEIAPVVSEELQAAWQAAAEASLVSLDEPPEPAVAAGPDQYLVLVTCRDEKEQVALLGRLHGEGFACKALLS